MTKKPAHHGHTKRTKKAAKKATATAKAGGTTARASLRAMVVREVPAAEFKDKCLELLDGVRERRYEVVVTKHGKPTARIVAPEQGPPSLWGAMRGTMMWKDDEDLISPELDIWKDYL